MDDADGTASIELGPSAEQELLYPCVTNGECEEPLGASAKSPLSNRESAREHWWGAPSLFSRGGSLLPSLHADARYIDTVIVSKASTVGLIYLNPEGVYLYESCT